MILRYWPCALLLVTASSASAEPIGPIVAVFDVESRQAPLSQEALQALSDFLAVRLASTGQFRVIPRGQVKERLTKLKVESYKACYDQACQIELGRELAANKSLAGRLTLFDGQCLFALELYDLRSATAEFAHSARVACSEGALFEAFSAGVRALAGWARSRQAPASSAAPIETPKVTVYFRTTPPGTDVLVDGLARGKTPLGLSLERGRRYRVALHNDDCLPAAREIVAEDALRVDVPLRLTEAARLDLATTSEWMGLGIGPSFMHGASSADVAVNVRLGTIKWRRFYWTLLDLTMMVGLSDFHSSATTVTASATVMDVGMRAGYPLYLGRRGQHQLLGGLGLQAQVFSDSSPASGGTATMSQAYFALSPGLDYVYNTFDGLLPVGIGVRACLPVARDFGGAPYPWQVFATANVGFSLYRVLMAIKNAAPAAPRSADQTR